MSLNEKLVMLADIAASPRKMLERYTAEGKKAIGCFPYYAPEELVYAAGMIPFGIWGARGKIQSAKQYFPAFYCTIAQMGLELSLNGKLKGLSGVIMSSMCDTLRPLTQNFRVANPDMPFIFLAHPQNRKLPCGVDYTVSEYARVKERLEGIAGKTVTDDDIRRGIAICNANRAARREFVKLAGEHPEAVGAKLRSGALKSAYFMDKTEHTAMLREINARLASLPASQWRGKKIVISGILDDFEDILDAFDENRLAVAADDIAQESRSIRVDADENAPDPLRALAEKFAAEDQDTLLYDPAINSRPAHIVELVRESGASGVAVMMMQFCDPEEMEYPSLKKALDEAGIPSIQIGVEQQMTDFGQAKTAIQAFADML